VTVVRLNGKFGLDIASLTILGVDINSIRTQNPKWEYVIHFPV